LVPTPIYGEGNLIPHNLKAKYESLSTYAYNELRLENMRLLSNLTHNKLDLYFKPCDNKYLPAPCPPYSPLTIKCINI
jgi:hypothetical protein